MSPLDTRQSFDVHVTGLNQGGSTYCGDLTAGANTVALGLLVTASYAPGGTPLPAATAIESIQWQAVTDPTPFNFCIKNLTATQ